MVISDSVFANCTSLISVTFGAGSNISLPNGFATNAFPNGINLINAYNAGKAGTYTRAVGGTTWTKQ
jgi:hypothetical protein